MKQKLEVVETARGNLFSLRDDAFFDKLASAFGIQPQNEKERFTLIKMADDLQLAEESGLLDQEDRFAVFGKQATDAISVLHQQNDEDNLIHDLAKKIAADNPTMRESAAVFFNAVASEEE